ncbi:MAG: YkgJ family cysteine cluster protein [Sulfuricella sp.]|nr:YkgJ family cysteine cluster protein [Sulfuricella sp.]
MSDPDSERIRNGQDLCLACGLCCQGVWFRHVGVDPDEAKLAQQAGLTLEFSGKDTTFQQPCVLHQNNQCSAYNAWRPKACACFRCALLDHYTEGQLSLGEAIVHVNAVKALAGRVRGEMADFRGVLSSEFNAQLTAQSLESNNDQKSLPPEIELDAVSLIFYYKKYFKKKHDGK